MTRAFYNDNDRHVAAWMRELIKDGLIPDGEVDETDIRELDGSRLSGFEQVHLFAGIGGWAYALELAGWPKGRPVWTGSCPCQPFSLAGKRKGTADERHLWPYFMRLIRECRPPTIFGEQVPGAIRQGWLDGVFTDLEAEGYSCGAVVLGAHSVGAPHIRQRLFWVGDSSMPRAGNDERGIRGLPESATAWAGASIVCGDGKSRRIEPGIFPLAHGIPGRVGLLRGAGNAIVPQVAATFIKAFLEETENERL